MVRRLTSSTLFPYTTLFRSLRRIACAASAGRGAGRRCPCTAGHHRSEEHTSELQSLRHLVCRLLLEKKTSPRSNRRSEEHTSELQSIRHLVCRRLLEQTQRR